MAFIVLVDSNSSFWNVLPGGNKCCIHVHRKESLWSNTFGKRECEETLMDAGLLRTFIQLINTGELLEGVTTIDISHSCLSKEPIVFFQIEKFWK